MEILWMRQYFDVSKNEEPLPEEIANQEQEVSPKKEKKEKTPPKKQSKPSGPKLPPKKSSQRSQKAKTSIGDRNRIGGSDPSQRISIEKTTDKSHVLTPLDYAKVLRLLTKSQEGSKHVIDVPASILWQIDQIEFLTIFFSFPF